MQKTLTSICLLVLGTSLAFAGQCPGNPEALGTSRVITVDASDHTRIGTMQYGETLPLADKEVVLTFDDGPLPQYTTRILEALAAQCVKATFFMVGRQARAYPDYVRRVYNAGHTVATHSQTHPRIFTRLSLEKAELEIDDGIASVTAALGDPHAVAPFFRFPGLGRSAPIEAYLASLQIMTWSADFPADDWRHIKASEIIRRALARLEAKGKGVLLLHDIQPATALALPTLLAELKSRGYRIVHVVPTGPDRPKTVTEPEQWVLHRGPQPGAWPRVLPRPSAVGTIAASGSESLGLSLLPEPAVAIPPSPAMADWVSATRTSGQAAAVRAGGTWPPIVVAAVARTEPGLPAPSLQSFGYPYVVPPTSALPVVRAAPPARRPAIRPRTRHAKHAKPQRVTARRTAEKPDVAEAMPRHSATDSFFTHRIR